MLNLTFDFTTSTPIQRLICMRKKNSISTSACDILNSNSTQNSATRLKLNVPGMQLLFNSSRSFSFSKGRSSQNVSTNSACRPQVKFAATIIQRLIEPYYIQEFKLNSTVLQLNLSWNSCTSWKTYLYFLFVWVQLFFTVIEWLSR